MNKKLIAIILSAILFVAAVTFVVVAFEPDTQSGSGSEPDICVSVAGDNNDVSYRDAFSDYEYLDDYSLLSAYFSETVITKDQSKLDLVFVAPEKTVFFYGRYHTLEQFKNGSWVGINTKPDVWWTEEAIFGGDGSKLTVDLDKFDFDRVPGRYRVSVEIGPATLYAEFEIK